MPIPRASGLQHAGAKHKVSAHLAQVFPLKPHGSPLSIPLTGRLSPREALWWQAPSVRILSVENGEKSPPEVWGEVVGKMIDWLMCLKRSSVWL